MHKHTVACRWGASAPLPLRRQCATRAGCSSLNSREPARVSKRLLGSPTTRCNRRTDQLRRVAGAHGGRAAQSSGRASARS